MRNIIKQLLREETDKTITCKNCGWKWKKSEGGPDMYFCHKCGTDNTPDNISEENNLDWVEDVIKNSDVYIPWVKEAIKGFEEWKGIAYQENDEIGLSISELKSNPTKKVVEHAINLIEKWKGFAFVEGDDFDWALGTLKMSINPYSWKRFGILE